MTTPQLPDDPAHWPTDPYALLGVARGVLPQELRRVYARLIRQYRPDSAPEQFRRVREAYEAVVRDAEVERSPSATVTSVPLFTPDAAAADEVQRLWEQAIRGAEAAAYAGLQRVAHAQPGRLDVYLRLYWLLALCPDLGDRRASAWLVQAAEQAGWNPALLETVRREAAAEPEFAAGDGFARLLRFGEPGLVLNLADWRWAAAARLGRWQVIRDDLERLRAPARAQGDETWVRLLQKSLGYLAWTDAPALLSAVSNYFGEIKSLDHVHRHLDQELDETEYLEEVSTAWQELRGDPGLSAELLALIPICWTRPADEVRTALLSFLEAVTRYPGSALAPLGAVAEKAPAVFNCLVGAVYRLGEAAPAAADNRSGQLIGDLLSEYLVLLPRDAYGHLRLNVLSFCLRERIPPETVADAVHGRAPDYLTVPGPPLSALLAGDWPLRFVCLAQRTLTAWM